MKTNKQCKWKDSELQQMRKERNANNYTRDRVEKRNRIRDIFLLKR